MEDTNNNCCSEDDVENNENDDVEDEADAAIPSRRRVRMTDLTLLLFVMSFLI
jgi:hypothetical protein